MELKARLLRAATARPGVLLAVRPGATRERLAVEAELARRGWPCVATPAAANLLVVVGEPGLEPDDWAERLWLGVPAPRARVTVTEAAQVAAGLDEGHAAVTEAVGPPAHSAGKAEEARGSNHDGEHHEHHEGQDAEPDSGPSAHEGHDAHDGGQGTSGSAGAAQHGEHGEHDGHGMHGGHDMGVVAGLPMAARADDRDGLRLDRLHVPFGPALPDWPIGLVLRLELQGDVVQRAAVERAAAPASSLPPFWNEPWLRSWAGEHVAHGEAARRLCAAHLDSLGRFLAVAGWGDAAVGARYRRDLALAGGPRRELRSLVSPLIRRIRRSWTLRWLTAGLGVLSAEQAHRMGVTGPALVAGGDVHSRVLVWLDEIERSAVDLDAPERLSTAALTGPRGRVDGAQPPSQALLDALPDLLEGTEFACARLIVASLDPDLDELIWAGNRPQGPPHA
ncbi:hypothetical protein ACODT5_21985 [Streptomyces sp. 5.8]|uniref:hypothetical protein n=1 Tax=Streptomyces sp. 5.8 TaxID=3406571 RepID=UPI003BB667E5